MNRDQKPRMMDEPEPCFIRMRLGGRHSPWVGARIFPRLGVLCGEINGQPGDPLQIWHSGEFVTKEEFLELMKNPPNEMSIDFSTMKPVW